MINGTERQLELFGKQPSAREDKRKRKEEKGILPILYPRKVSYSSLAARDICPRKYYYLYPGNWWGWDTHAPMAAKKAYWQKRLSPWQAWGGTIVHDFVEGLLWNDIDNAISDLTGVTPRSQEELLDAVKARFETEWRQSRQWTWDTFKKVRRRTKPVWLKEHESGQWPTVDAGDNDPVNIQHKNRCWRWVQRSVNSMLNSHSKFHEHTPYQRWLVIEGNRLEEGLITNHQNESQAELRKKEVYPEEPIEVDGEMWAFSIKIDFMVYSPDGWYTIMDFKTGSSRHWRSHKEQLELYAAFALASPDQFDGLPAITEQNLCLRAVYTNPAVRIPFKQWHVGRGDKGRFINEAKKMIARLRRHHLRLDELDNDEREELRLTLPPRLFAGPEGLFETDEKTIRDGVSPDTLVALPSLFPPTQAEKGNAKMCANCECLASCREGQELLNVAAKN